MSTSKGFTLVELIVGVAILALLSTPFFFMFHSSYVMSHLSSRITAAALVGQNHFEQLVGKDEAYFGFNILDNDFGDIKEFVIDDENYFSEVKVTWGIPIIESRDVGGGNMVDVEVYLENLIRVDLVVYYKSTNAEVYELSGVINIGSGGF